MSERKLTRKQHLAKLARERKQRGSSSRRDYEAGDDRILITRTSKLAMMIPPKTWMWAWRMWRKRGLQVGVDQTFANFFPKFA